MFWGKKKGKTLLNLVFCGISLNTNNFFIDFALFANHSSEIFLGVILEGNSKLCFVFVIVDGGWVHSLCFLLDGLVNMFDDIEL